MADTFQLEVATPEHLVVSEQVTSAEVPGKSGYLGILAGHAPLLSALDPGILTYEGGGGEKKLVLDGGFVEVFDNHVRVLADGAAWPEKVDQAKARKQLEEAMGKLSSAQDPAETEAALHALKQAQAKIDAAGS
jgi:F-type H+-transporting ATPase subunit epsilon